MELFYENGYLTVKLKFHVHPSAHVKINFSAFSICFCFQDRALANFLQSIDYFLT